MRAGCARVVALCLFDESLAKYIEEKLRENMLVIRVPPECPLDVMHATLWALGEARRKLGEEVSPDQLVIVTDSTTLIHDDEVRRMLGPVKIIRVKGCTPEEVVASILAAACEPVYAPCEVDAGLGWLQA
ncbi:hypothetical protein Pyrfu_1092 [Pyrolobus fumarii 1A]|uniref:Uncharacterized protein n=1 Tax=Pyrolobus fumarii (strain DSM 11204 / 1A) TaxID=694429 RepID=G0EF63_PYRF1|nr:hypothetical protein [Pyrolobus fumarii]AEM38960.1 hypothetical protein Pyrfu_1092 [Pyrolobus fumarii 1A]